MYQKQETVFQRLSKHLEFRQKYSAARRIFNSLLGVGYPNETSSLVLDVLLYAVVLSQFLDTESTVNSLYKLGEYLSTFAVLKYVVVFSRFFNDRKFAYNEHFRSVGFLFSVKWEVNV